MKVNRLYILFLFSGFLMFGCKKEDSSPPEINLITPIDNQHYNVFDTIFVSGKAIDNNTITSISISLQDENQNPVCQLVSTVYNSPEVAIKEYYPISNIHLDGGVYYLQVTAYDGINFLRSFVKLNITSLPREQTAVYIVTQEQNTIQVSKLNDNGLLDSAFEMTGQFNDAALSSYYQQIYLLTNEGRMEAYDIVGNEKVWEKTGINNVLYDYNGRLKVIENRVWVGYANGIITSFDNLGIARGAASLSEDGFFPVNFFNHETFLIIEERNNSNTPNRIGKNIISTGVSMFHFDIGLDVVEFFSLDDEKLMIWGNENNLAKVCSLTVVYDLIFDVGNFPDAKLNSVVQLEYHTFLASIGNHLYHYSSETNSLYVFKENTSAQQMLYDEKNGLIYMTDGNNLNLITYPDGNVIQTVNCLNEIKDVEILYNKK